MGQRKQSFVVTATVLLELAGFDLSEKLQRM